ncbi:hypothetical protein HD806DRAFT_197980 [Xylariaceae sp. AK1471]|nr:hypothetical protein HD806DRAFT_197980 [Xylariaceae sp. AK1471]
MNISCTCYYALLRSTTLYYALPPILTTSQQRASTRTLEASVGGRTPHLNSLSKLSSAVRTHHLSVCS